MSWQRGISGAFGPVGLEMLQQYLRQLRLMSGLGANSAAACLAAFQVERDQSDRTQALRSCREIQSFLWFLGELPLADRGAVWAMIGEELCHGVTALLEEEVLHGLRGTREAIEPTMNALEDLTEGPPGRDAPVQVREPFLIPPPSPERSRTLFVWTLHFSLSLTWFR